MLMMEQSLFLQFLSADDEAVKLSPLGSGRLGSESTLDSSEIVGGRTGSARFVFRESSIRFLGCLEANFNPNRRELFDDDSLAAFGGKGMVGAVVKASHAVADCASGFVTASSTVSMFSSVVPRLLGGSIS